MSLRIEVLKQMAQEGGTEKMKELVIIAENYILGLNNIFYDRDVTEMVLKNIDFQMFLRELEEKGIFKNKSSMMIKLLVMNVFHIVRHIWELKDKNGNIKTGDDLHRAWPLMFNDDKTSSIESLFKNMQHF
jgi:hypothetical protein